MHFDLDMGKYVFFVWGSYGATALGLIGLVVLTLRAHSERKKQLAALRAAMETSK
jgi:heme exporter protein CcmD